MKDYRDLVYNAHSMLKDYYTYEDISMVPIKDLLALIEYFKPKLRDIANRQARDTLMLEMQGKKNQLKPGSNRR